MVNDLDSLSLGELKELRTKVDRMISGYEDRKRREALRAAEEAVKEFGFNLNDLTGKKARRVGGTAAKYANPEDSSMTWSGRGRRPVWLQDQLKNGRSLEDMLI